MSPRSRYILVIENLSTYTRSKDIMKEMERYGRIYDVERDIKERIALVEFKRSVYIESNKVNPHLALH